MDLFKKIILIVILFIGTQYANSQIDTRNKVNYGTEENYDVNSIKIPSKKVRKKKVKKESSVEDLTEVRNIRYRKKRNISEKCFKDAPKKESCGSK